MTDEDRQNRKHCREMRDREIERERERERGGGKEGGREVGRAGGREVERGMRFIVHRYPATQPSSKSGTCWKVRAIRRCERNGRCLCIPTVSAEKITRAACPQL